MSPQPVVEPARRSAYEKILHSFDESGVNPDSLFGNSSYYRRDEDGCLIELCGHHPSLIHWPLQEYLGGEELVRRLKKEVMKIAEIAGAWNVVWVNPQHWHCTVFSPVHSSDPTVIARRKRDFENAAQTAVSETSTYRLFFTRILVTSGHGIKAVGYSSNPELDALRHRLCETVPEGSASELIHISLGNFITVPEASQVSSLKQHLHTFGGDRQHLGRCDVDFLCYAQYAGPFVRMKVMELRRLPMKRESPRAKSASR